MSLDSAGKGAQQFALVTDATALKSGAMVFGLVMEALASADEIWGGVEERDYPALMEAVIAECQQRIKNAKEWAHDSVSPVSET